jgi:hypothetical protein
MLHAIKRYASLAWMRRRYVALAPFYLLRGRIKLSLLSTNAILAEFNRPPGLDGQAHQRSRIDPKLVAWSIAACAKRVPWRSDCLIQAMAAALWLRQHGYEPQLRLGVAPLDSQPAPGSGEPFRAHAWLELDGKAVIGGNAGEFVAFPLRSSHPAQSAAGAAPASAKGLPPTSSGAHDST